jgi:hypothetical protein
MTPADLLPGESLLAYGKRKLPGDVLPGEDLETYWRRRLGQPSSNEEAYRRWKRALKEHGRST